MKKLLKKTLKLILPIVLGGFILFWVYRDFDFAEAGDVLKHGTNWWWMLFSLLFGIFAQVFRGWRWRQTLEPLDRGLCRHIFLPQFPVFFHRMTTYIDSNSLLLESQKCLFVVLAHVRQCDLKIVLFLLRGNVKKAHLALHDRLFLS